MAKPVRALVVDDSAFMRHTITRLLSSDPSIEVVDTARNGADALEKIGRLDVDVVTMDIEMPKMDGLTALGNVMQRHPTPVVMVSSWTRQGADATVRALALGAVDFVCKPSGSISLDMHTLRDELITKVKHAAGVRLGEGTKPVTRDDTAPRASAEPKPHARPAARTRSAPVRVVAIGSSTGGPKALHRLLPLLPKDFPAPVVVVQHMPTGFTRSLAEHLDEVCQIKVREAQEGDVLLPGLVLVAPGDRHLKVGRLGTIELTQDPPMHGVRPAVDVTFSSLASVVGAGCLAIVLTGMGSDGAQGAMRIKNAGGQVIAEHESTCVVYGMPKSVIDSGAANQALPLPQIAGAIEQAVTGMRALRTTPA